MTISPCTYKSPQHAQSLNSGFLARQKVGQKIRQLRKQKGWTQQRLAIQTNGELGEDSIGLIERGLREIRLCQIMAIAKALNVPVNELIVNYRYYVVYRCMDENGALLKEGDAEMVATERLVSIQPIKDFVQEQYCPKAVEVFIYNVQPPIVHWEENSAM